MATPVGSGSMDSTQTQDNYLLWQFLMVPFLEGQDLYGYVDGTNPRPPQLIADPTSGLLVANPSYQAW
jgi:hypothetical protein